MAKNNTRRLSESDAASLLRTLGARFRQMEDRHKGLRWEDVAERLLASPQKLWSLSQMEASGGAPDVIGYDDATNQFIFVDCAPESPTGRRSLCYDDAALDSRKEHKPAGSALGLAEEMGIELLTETEYRALQRLGSFDTKTSSWVHTPEHIRKLGGALFCDRRYDTVFLYHNGAESYYAARGFRGSLRV